MKKHNTSKKFRIQLPPDFQEVLMTNEMKLQEGLTVETLRKLVYLYTRGMEHYDLANKTQFRQFYNDKLITLLTRKDVVEFLDKNPINFKDKGDLDKLFAVPQKKPQQQQQQPPNSQQKLTKSSTIKNKPQEEDIDNYSKQFSNMIRKNSIKLVKTIVDPQDIRMFVKKKILEVSTNLNKIDQAMTNEIVDQMTEFESNKRAKKVRDSPYIINRDENNTNNDEENSDKNSNEENENVIKNTEDELKLIEQITNINIDTNNDEKENKDENAMSKNLIGQNPMLREIEAFVQKNMDEMYQSLEELKASFQNEIKEAEDNGFDDIAEGLKEDLQNELDNMKDQFEEQRRIETEKIKRKYSKRNSLLG